LRGTVEGGLLGGPGSDHGGGLGKPAEASIERLHLWGRGEREQQRVGEAWLDVLDEGRAKA